MNEESGGDITITPEESPQMSTSDMRELIDLLLEDKSIPKDYKETFLWSFGDKENALTYMDGKDIINHLRRLDMALTWMRMTIPSYKFDFLHSLMMENMEAKASVKLRRSFKGFERKMQTTQIRQYQTQRIESERKKVNKVVGGLKNLFGMGGKE